MAASLFQRVDFISHSGLPLTWKIECDALTPQDWEALAQMATEVLPPFSHVLAVPSGGLPFAEALRAHKKEGIVRRVLIADDVLTTGASMEEYRLHSETGTLGVVAFARGPCPDWVTPLFTFSAVLSQHAAIV